MSSLVRIEDDLFHITVCCRQRTQAYYHSFQGFINETGLPHEEGVSKLGKN